MTGDGSAGNPWIITDIDDLQAIGTGSYALNHYYELANDIDASATSGWNAGAGFVPIGTFTGSFDGKGYTITGLYVNRPTTDYNGLFGRGEGVTIQNVHLVGGSITGRNYCGGLVGRLEEYYDGAITTAYTILNCSATANVTAMARRAGGLIGTASASYGVECLIYRSYATGNVESLRDSTVCEAGGLIADTYASNAFLVISECYATGNAHCPKGRVGGLIGSGGGETVRNCYSTGDTSGDDPYRAGGFVASTSGSYDNCYSTGIVAATPSGLRGGFTTSTNENIVNCFWDTETSGIATSGSGTGKTTAEMKLLSTFGAWNISASTTDLNNGYPYLGWQLGSSPTWYIYEADVAPVNTDVYIVALEALRNIEMSAMGRIYVDEEGNLCYENRYARQL